MLAKPSPPIKFPFEIMYTMLYIHGFVAIRIETVAFGGTKYRIWFIICLMYYIIIWWFVNKTWIIRSQCSMGWKYGSYELNHYFNYHKEKADCCGHWFVSMFAIYHRVIHIVIDCICPNDSSTRLIICVANFSSYIKLTLLRVWLVLVFGMIAMYNRTNKPTQILHYTKHWIFFVPSSCKGLWANPTHLYEVSSTNILDWVSLIITIMYGC